MFSFFNRTNKTPTDFSFLGTDMHSHLIPGIDDGAKSMEESIGMIRQLMDLGYQKIITTPHIMGEYYPNTPEIILQGLEQLKIALKEENISIELEAAAEYYIDDYFEKILNKEESLLTFGDRHLLIEFSTFAPPANYLDIIFTLNTRGYQPILAHPERYLYFAEDFQQFEKIKSLGCALQVNLLSLMGHYGAGQKKLAIRFLKAGMVDYLGTDAHRKGHLDKLSKINNDRSIKKLLLNSTFLNQKL